MFKKQFASTSSKHFTMDNKNKVEMQLKHFRINYGKPKEVSGY